MKSYSQRAMFETGDFVLLRMAVDVVTKLPDPPAGEEWRCHEVARIVQYALRLAGHTTLLQDGLYGTIDHSWLWLPPYPRRVLLDTYAVGAHPQVQLRAGFVGDGYKPGELRDDIDVELLERWMEDL